MRMYIFAFFPILGVKHCDLKKKQQQQTAIFSCCLGIYCMTTLLTHSLDI